MKRIYLDYASTTPADPEVIREMLPYFSGIYGNPSSVHAFGREARKVVDSVREKVARFIGAKPYEIVFTSGGTESDNTAVKGIAYAARSRGDHIITSSIEHRAVLNPAGFLERQGFPVTRVPVDSTGMVDPDAVLKAITPKTILISVMHANNEIGTMQPLSEIGAIAHERGIPFHTDAVQTFGHIPVNVDELNVDLLSASAHKLYGPKGVGIMYIRSGTKIGRFMHGGAQEKGRRASTHNVPGIAGLGKAIEIAERDMHSEMLTLTAFQDKLISNIVGSIKRTKLNGHPEKRLPGNVNISFRNVQGERLLKSLDEAGIACSTGSACNASNTGPSHVLTAIGLPLDLISGSLRITLGKYVKEEEIDCVLDILPRLVRKMSSFVEYPE
jgi:cysteine desulfurase